DRFPRRADGLHYIVFKNGRFADAFENRDGQHRDRNRGRNGQPGLERQIDRRRSEDDSEERAKNDGFEGKFRQYLFVWNVWFKRFLVLFYFCHAYPPTGYWLVVRISSKRHPPSPAGFDNALTPEVRRRGRAALPGNIFGIA